MSLIRKSSRTNLRPTVEDFTACMDQKNSLIVTLKSQVESLHPRLEQVNRISEELRKTKGKYEELMREQETCLINNQERLEVSARNVHELRAQAQHLEDEIRLRAQALKDAKFEVQKMCELRNKKDEDVAELTGESQELQNQADVKKLEEDRLRMQCSQQREDLNKGKREGSLIREQNDNIKQKCLKTQSYIRNLVREESNLNQNLSRIEDENAKLVGNISELDTISNKQKDCQEAEFNIATLELQKKRWGNENREKVKQLSMEREKWRSLNEECQNNRKQASQLNQLMSETSEEINFIIGKNNQIFEVNSQLQQDLKVCQRHMDNVLRVNRNMEEQIENYHQVNLKAISKLQQPFSDKTNDIQQLPIRGETSARWGKASRADYETGDFSLSWK